MAKQNRKKRRKSIPGRKPVQYTPARGRRVCRLVAKSKRGHYEHYRKYEWFPHPVRLQRWLQKYEDFRKLYFVAKAVQAQQFASEQTTIADDFRKFCLKANFHPGKLNALAMATKMQIESRRWAASRLAPKDWGDKLDIAAQVDTPGGNIDRLADELATLASRAGSQEDDSEA